MAKTSPVQFLKEVRQEALKVTWPSRKETITTTIMVFIMVFLASMFMLFADWAISVGIEWILGAGA